MAKALRSLGFETTDDVLVGLDAPDDAAVYAWDDERSLVSTVDFFTPVVDDPYTFGAIAATNALSDIYAMGGRPLFALNIVGFPNGELDPSILTRILEGGRDKAAEAGVAIIGGHTIDDKEPKYGMVVIGVAPPERLYRKGDARTGDRLVLSKAIGTGIIATAIKKGVAPDAAVEAAVKSMLRLNDAALRTATRFDVGAITDVTGFGLLGHLSEVARLSGVGATVEHDRVPKLHGALELARRDCIPGGTRRNRAHVETLTQWPDSLGEVEKYLLCDAQTSGGLLITVRPEQSSELVELLRAEGHDAADIGGLVSEPRERTEVR